VCAALKVLAAGNSFQDVASFSGMSVTSAEASFHLFCDKFPAALWDNWVKLPVGEELEKAEGVFRGSGYPGAIGSTDCTHFKWDGGPFSEARGNTGKEGYRTVAVEATCDHSGRIIAATKSYPGSENDKAIIARDRSVWRIRDHEPWSSYKYSFYNADGSQTEFKGAWLVVDGGYPKIPLLVPPITIPQSRSMPGADGWRACARTSSAAMEEGMGASGSSREVFYSRREKEKTTRGSLCASSTICFTTLTSWT
ncbi:unnamed protein product, partial [Hapterophycus canaliculatus]